MTLAQCSIALPDVQVSDTTKADSSNAVDYQNKQLQRYATLPWNEIILVQLHGFRYYLTAGSLDTIL